MEQQLPFQEKFSPQDSESGDREELTRGGHGELWYRGPNVISGYFKRPDLTEKAFDQEGFFTTGDLFQIKDRRLHWFLRSDQDIIIRGGFNISAPGGGECAFGSP